MMKRTTGFALAALVLLVFAGLTFAGVPLEDAYGSPLAVEVLRHCPGDQNPGVDVSSKYPGIAAAHLGMYDPVFGGYTYYVPLLYADKAGFNSVMYIQNGGLECSSVEIWFKAQDDCLRARICEVFTLAPGWNEVLPAVLIVGASSAPETFSVASGSTLTSVATVSPPVAATSTSPPLISKPKACWPLAATVRWSR